MSFSYRFIGGLLLVSAFLLFLVQPLISKSLLPVLGGTPAVWTTSMLFFQMLLLGGYCWAHVMVRYMPLYGPPVIQFCLTVAGYFMITSGITDSPDFATGQMTLWQLKTMFIMVGIPYFVLATNAPLYQALYKNFTEHTTTEKTPYALYSLSNIGSFAALLAYPFILEPLLTLENQEKFWKYGYGVLCLFVAGSGIVFFMLYRNNSTLLKARHREGKSLTKESPTPIKTVLLWLLLAFMPSGLMLGVTSYITTDIASVPLLWIIPLAFYLASFIIAFAEPPLWWAKNINKAYFMAFLCTVTMLLSILFPLEFFTWLSLVLHYVGFFLVATYCHLLLARHKPDSGHLTFFFIIVSLGGALGGLFSALIAYRIFNTSTEYPAILCLFMIFIACYKKDGWKKIPYQGLITFGVLEISLALYALSTNFPTWAIPSLCLSVLLFLLFWNVRFVVAGFAVAMTLLFIGMDIYSHNDVYRHRNVFGVLRIVDDQKTGLRSFFHGSTAHGLQKIPLEQRPQPVAYYHVDGSFGEIFRFFDTISGSAKQDIAILGMGTGGLSCYTHDKRHFDFYEIDKDVVSIATNPDYFTFLSGCQPDATIILGDARINLQQQDNNKYDMIVLDVFSSDAIPVHFLTREAFAIYQDKLKPDGLIVFHISNRYFDLSPVIINLAKAYDMTVAEKIDLQRPDDPSFRATQIVITSHSEKIIQEIAAQNKGWHTDDLPQPDMKLWTDSYANIFQALKF